MDDTSLELDLGLGYGPKPNNGCKHNRRPVVLDLSISHTPNDHANSSSSGLKIDVEEDERKGTKNKIFPNSSKDEDDDDDDDINFSNNGTRKKLRLTKDQTVLLEDTFKQHCTLNMAQKQALAQQLKLKPRQVEVWFQNRRARTKLKQTELNYQFLKKNCQRLNEENQRLKKELLELKSFANTEQILPRAQSLLSSFSYRFPEESVAQYKCQSCRKMDETIKEVASSNSL